MFGMKSLCPGASIRVTTLDVVSNLVMPTSMVTPLQQARMEAVLERKNLLLVQKKTEKQRSEIAGCYNIRKCRFKVLINFRKKKRHHRLGEAPITDCPAQVTFCFCCILLPFRFSDNNNQ